MSGCPASARYTGDASLKEHPMERIALYHNPG